MKTVPSKPAAKNAQDKPKTKPGGMPMNKMKGSQSVGFERKTGDKGKK